MAICSMPKKQEEFFKLKNQDFEFLNSEETLSRKLTIMVDRLSLTKEDHCDREKIVNDLRKILKPYYPECDILIFGSSANGFGFKDCDLDLLFLPFPVYCNLDFKDEGSGKMPTPEEVLSGNMSVIYHMNEEMHLNLVHQIMNLNKNYFKNVKFIPARCPLLSIDFVSSPIRCDFTVSNRLVMYNTELLEVYGSLDSRVKPLVMFLRYWTKSLGFQSKHMFSSYCLTLLVIFHLQNTTPPVLPSVKYLNEIAGYSRIIDRWETAICLDVEHIKKNRYRNQETLYELLFGFFDFYWNFDFVQNIVSVYEGRPLPVKLVKESTNERLRTFLVTPLSVQDPFILSRNVSRNIKMKTPFKLSLLIAKDILEKNFNFEVLFEPTYYQSTMKPLFASTELDFSLHAMYIKLQMSYEMCNKLPITTHLKPWFEKVIRCIQDVLQYGLLLECEVIDKTDLNAEVSEPSKKKRICYNNITGLECIVTIQCIVSFPTMYQQNRLEVLAYLKKTRSNFEVEESEIEVSPSLKIDFKISNELSKDEIKNVTKIPALESTLPYTFICDCFRYPESSNLSDIVIRFSPLTNVIAYHRTRDFLKSFVEKNIKLMLAEV